MLLPFAAIILVPLFILSFSRFEIADLNEARLYLAIAFFIAGVSFCASAIGTIAGKGEKPDVGNGEKLHSGLVVSGPYAYVRNPLLLGVFLILAGESFFFGSLWIGLWALCFLSFKHWYLKRVEEPALAARFGHEYLEYYRNVPRWIPKATPWKFKIFE